MAGPSTAPFAPAPRLAQTLDAGRVHGRGCICSGACRGSDSLPSTRLGECIGCMSVAGGSHCSPATLEVCDVPDDAAFTSVHRVLVDAEFVRGRAPWAHAQAGARFVACWHSAPAPFCVQPIGRSGRPRLRGRGGAPAVAAIIVTVGPFATRRLGECLPRLVIAAAAETAQSTGSATQRYGPSRRTWLLAPAWRHRGKGCPFTLWSRGGHWETILVSDLRLGRHRSRRRPMGGHIHSQALGVNYDL